MIGLAGGHGQSVHFRRNLRFDDADLSFNVRLFIRTQEFRYDGGIIGHSLIHTRTYQFPIVAGDGFHYHRYFSRSTGCG